MSSVQPLSSATASTSRYARCVQNSKRMHWDIDRDVIRGRVFSPGEKFLPDGLSMVERLADLLHPEERRFLACIQGRTYANMFALVERYVGAKMMALSRDHWLGDQDAMEALVRFTDEELKHQALFRRIESLAARIMPVGYLFGPEPNMVAQFVLGKSTWAVLALTCHLELVSQVHYRESIGPDPEVSPLFKDVFLFHWKEESQHAVVDELEWLREDAKLGPGERENAVDDFIALVMGVDGMLQAQADVDARYFMACGPQRIARGREAAERIRLALLGAYRWQYILSGAAQPHFNELLASLVTPAQGQRIDAALAELQ